ncbi:two-component system response regulator [Streptomyces rectiviolaceus]|uniref:Response regulatory domain-containing protein n=1 Tax=Streptomyces rectiviolaceus TaxID=332591 RepID=A0ABP6MBN9_9ACTN
MSTDSAILVVDDHKDTLFALESALVPLGYPLLSASNGDDALRVILRGGVGLILLDVRMPVVSGLDVVRYVRHLDQTRSIPIILLTGFDVSREVATAAFVLGVADVALKPIDPLTLRTKVRYLFETYTQLRSMRQEIDDLRAQVKAGTAKPTNDSHSAPRRLADPQVET